MSFRIEDKIVLKMSYFLELRNYLKENNCKEIYSKRKILSIYFDNKNMEMFTDSEEGILPRKKIRIRNYPNNNDGIWTRETKISSVEGKYKTSKNINHLSYNEYLKKGIFDNNYGYCYPVSQVSYDREYWSIFGSRITIDYNISFRSLRDNKATFKDKETLILELKSTDDLVKSQNLLNKEIPYQRRRFSKYCQSIINLFGFNSQRVVI